MFGMDRKIGDLVKSLNAIVKRDWTMLRIAGTTHSPSTYMTNTTIQYDRELSRSDLYNYASCLSRDLPIMFMIVVGEIAFVMHCIYVSALSC
jgi:hypothetical protein